MAYRALYRQWRPRTFREMVGQRALLETLQNQIIHQRIAHAYLFCGSRGTGKTSTAKIFAKAINCEHPDGGNPCGECENCRRADLEETLDIIEIDAASNNGVDEMRDLRDTVKYPPQYGRYKVYIIDEVHMLSTSAFNALLKTLEEPPAHVVFILATTEPQKLPATSLSRCQRFDFGRISVTDIMGRLKQAAEGENAQISNGALMLIARAAEGGMRDALSLLDMCLGYSEKVDEALVREILGTTDRGFLFQFSEALAEENAGTTFRLIDELMRNGRDPSAFVREISAHIRALISAKCCGNELEQILEITQEDAAEYIRQAESFTISRLMHILDLYMALETDLRYAAAPRLALENASMKACLRTTDADAQALADRISELEGKIAQMEEKLRNGMISTGSASPSAPGKAVPRVADSARSREAASTEKAVPKATQDHPDAIWKEMMSRIRKREPGILGMLIQGKFIGTEGQQFLWQSSTPNSIFTTSLNSPAKKQTISEILSEIAGKPCDFRAIEMDAPAHSQQGMTDDEYVGTLYSTFGKEPVDVVDHL